MMSAAGGELVVPPAAALFVEVEAVLVALLTLVVEDGTGAKWDGPVEETATLIVTEVGILGVASREDVAAASSGTDVAGSVEDCAAVVIWN